MYKNRRKRHLVSSVILMHKPTLRQYPHSRHDKAMHKNFNTYEFFSFTRLCAPITQAQIWVAFDALNNLTSLGAFTRSFASVQMSRLSNGMYLDLLLKECTRFLFATAAALPWFLNLGWRVQEAFSPLVASSTSTFLVTRLLCHCLFFCVLVQSHAWSPPSTTHYKHLW